MEAKRERERDKRRAGEKREGGKDGWTTGRGGTDKSSSTHDTIEDMAKKKGKKREQEEEREEEEEKERESARG